MGIGTGIAVAGSIAGSIGGAAIASHGANKAADTQAAAAAQAAQLQAQSADKALQFQKDQYNNTQAQQLPFLQTGQAGMANLAYLLGLPVQGNLYQGTAQGAKSAGDPQSTYGSRTFNDLISSGDPLVSPNQETTEAWKSQGVPYQDVWTPDGRSVAVRTDQVPQNGTGTASGTSGTGDVPLSSLVNKDLGAAGSLLNFQAPTAADVYADPSYQFRLAEGQKALERSAASRGDILSGGTAKGLEKFGSDYASQEYGNIYNRKYGENTDKFNRLATVLGVGQTSASNLQAAGTNAANNSSNIIIANGNNQAQGVNNAAAARASGYVGSANAWGGVPGAVSGDITQLLLLNKLLKNPTAPTGGGGFGV